MAGRGRTAALFVALLLAGCGTSTPTATGPATTSGPASASARASAGPSASTASATRLSVGRPDYGATGKGTTVVIVDRGIDWRNADFRKADGTTRIRAMLDLSAQTNWCAENRPGGVEFSQEQIDAALKGGPDLATHDGVGHGTATAGLAAGNGRSLPDLRYAGVAPEADLVIVRATAEAAPAHDGKPAEPAFNACIDDALAWADTWMTRLRQPAVAIWNAGTQWGPMDGTSATSRTIQRLFPAATPGRVFVATPGDEGGLPNHAGGEFRPGAPFSVPFKLTAAASYPTAWYTGAAPASVTITLDDGTRVGPVAANAAATGGPLQVIQYAPGKEFYPWTSTSGDRGVWMNLTGKGGRTGTITFEATGASGGRVDVYGDVLGPQALTSSIEFQASLVDASINDPASTRGVIVVGDYVPLTSFADVNGQLRDFSSEGGVGALWYRSSRGATRDGRTPIDVAAPGQNVPATLAAGSWWSTLTTLLPRDGQGKYIRFGGTSAAGPIVVGTVALMLQVNPNLTTEDVRAILRSTAAQDTFTGATPNGSWGYGKLDIAAAVAAARRK